MTISGGGRGFGTAGSRGCLLGSSSFPGGWDGCAQIMVGVWCWGCVGRYHRR